MRITGSASSLAVLILVGCPGADGPSVSGNVATTAPGAPVATVTVVRSWPHDVTAYTQGLDFHRGKLYEGPGLVGQSALREISLDDAKVVRQVALPSTVFGEGITVLDDKVYQLTWTSKTGFVYDLASFRKLRDFTYSGEGWGLTTDGQSLIMSDGTATIRFIDPKTFREQRTIQVHDGPREIRSLNELEWVKGDIYANVWMTDSIARIAPDDGRVKGWIHLPGLFPPSERRRHLGDPGKVEGAVLNGIAYDEANDRLVVTGKNWPKLFEIRIDSAPVTTTKPAS